MIRRGTGRKSLMLGGTPRRDYRAPHEEGPPVLPVGFLLTASDGLSSPPELEREREVHLHNSLASPLRLEIERPRFQEIVERDDSDDPVRSIPIDDRKSGEASFRHALHDQRRGSSG